MERNQIAVYHCPHCQEPIGAIRFYSSRREGRPTGAADTKPRKERRGDVNKAIATALREG